MVNNPGSSVLQESPRVDGELGVPKEGAEQPAMLVPASGPGTPAFPPGGALGFHPVSFAFILTFTCFSLSPLSYPQSDLPAPSPSNNSY